MCVSRKVEEIKFMFISIYKRVYVFVKDFSWDNVNKFV